MAETTDTRPSVFLLCQFVDASLKGERIKGAYATYQSACDAGHRLTNHSWHVAEWHIDGARNSHDALVAVAKRAIGACTCHATMRPDIPCLSCMAHAALKAAGIEGD
jgi:hypothetical protein